MIRELHEHVKMAYSPGLGRARADLPTPALILDLDLAKENLRHMALRMKTLHAQLRPHIKVHKCAELALLQVRSGAIGVCTATVWEGIVMSRAGIEDVLIANQVRGKDKIRALALASQQFRLTVAVDDPRNCDELDAAVCAAGGKLEVLIEVDVGMQRAGVRSPEEAVALARHLSALPRLRFRGVQGYEGHCMLEPDRETRIKKARKAMDELDEAVESLRRAGFPCEVVSAGGTGTYDITGADQRVTEIQAGSYVFMDMFHGNLVPGFSRALTVLGTVVMQHGKTIVLDCGRKAISIDFVPPVMVPYPFYQARYFAEEHAIFDVDERCQLEPGDTVELVPAYAPSTVNLFDAFHVVEGGVVTDIWPVIPRARACGNFDRGQLMKTLPRSVSRDEFDGLFQKLSNWGRWGQDDERGTLNYITPEHIRTAAGLVQSGRSVSLSLPINTVAGPDNPRPALHYMIHRHDAENSEGAPRFATDFLASEFHGDSFTHIDALCHVSHDGKLYNGKPAACVSAAGHRCKILPPSRTASWAGACFWTFPACAGPPGWSRVRPLPGKSSRPRKRHRAWRWGRRHLPLPHRPSPPATGTRALEQRLRRRRESRPSCHSPAVAS